MNNGSVEAVYILRALKLAGEGGGGEHGTDMTHARIYMYIRIQPLCPYTLTTAPTTDIHRASSHTSVCSGLVSDSSDR